ncbi:oligosaccharyl transferase stt3 subunit [Rhizoclosmatium hyalinum]|nr:oligosaccharyl transferase stt3 subunit [Rhizoclosmatium hyalinum]
MYQLKSSVASFDNLQLFNDQKTPIYAAHPTTHSTTINIDSACYSSYINGIHNAPKLSFQSNPPILDNSMGYAQGAHVNSSLNSLLARVVVKIPWKAVLQRLPGMWLLAVIALAVFGPTSCPTLYYFYLGLLNFLFLVNNLRTLYGIKFAYAESIKQATTDWLAEYLRITGATSGDDLSHDLPYDHILHVIIIPNYSEDVDTLCETLDVLASHRRALTQYRVCLAMEETEAGCIEKARMIMKLYSEMFFDITFTVHPSNLPGEIRGKSSNVAFASREMAKYSAAAAAASMASAAESNLDKIYGVSCNGSSDVCDIPYTATQHDHEILTVIDADTIFAEDYFAAVACHYATATPSQRKIMMFMPSTVFDRNSDQVPIFVRTCDTYWSLGVMSNMYESSPVKFPCSAYSISMDLCIAVNFWDAGPESIGEDLHMYLKCFFSTSGKLIMKPIFSAVSCCNIEGNGQTSSEFLKFTNGYVLKRTIYALFAPGYDPVIQLKNSATTKLGKEELVSNQNGIEPRQLRCLFHRILETHCLMGHFAILGLVRSVMAQLHQSSAAHPLPKPFNIFESHLGIPLTFDTYSAFIIFLCILCNFASASFYEKYFQFVGFERWALQTLPPKPMHGNKYDKYAMDYSGVVANNRLVGLATMAKHRLQFSKDHEHLQVQPLGRRPQLSSPRYAVNYIEWCLIPYAALFYFVLPQCHAQFMHLFTDKLDYRVSAKPQLRNSSLALLTMEEVLSSAKGFSGAQDWNEPYVAQVVNLHELGGSESDTKSVTLESEASRGDEGHYCMGASTAADAVWLRVVILVAIGVLSISSRLFSVIRFESVIHEFDPWFNYRSTMQLVEKGFYEFLNWFDDFSWYPLGRVVGGTVYPGIMITAGAAHWIMNKLNFPVDIRNVCVFLAPFFSAFTAVACYLLTTEIKDASAGLLAAAFIGIAPGYISRSVAGSYDNEGIAIFLLMITFYFWLKALKLGSSFYGGLTALFYFYMVSAWGGYVFIINLIPLHAFALLLMGRFTPRLYVAYSTFYVIGTLSSMQIPFVGFQPTRTSEHMAALGIFGLLQIIAFIEMIRSHLSANQFQSLFQGLILSIFLVGFAALVALTFGGYIAPWTGRFYSLWDTGYAKKYIPIIASVSEHQPTAWPAFFFDLQLLMPLFPAGIYFCFQELRDEHVFIIIYAVTGSYFAGVMVRLMLTLTPCVCIASAFAISKVLDVYLAPPKEVLNDEPEEETAATKPGDKAPERPKTILYGIKDFDSRLAVIVPISVVLVLFAWHCTWVTSSAYSSPSIVLASQNRDGSQHIIDDFREAYYWLRQNSEPDDKILSWWDYGYQITGMANRTVLVDNNTWNNTHIATVGKAMSCSEDVSYEIMKRHDVKFVLVIFGAVLGYSGDDINKFLWMVRIGEGVYPNDVSERSFFTDRGEYRVDDQATPTMKNSVMYKTSYYRFAELYGPNGNPYDRVRNQPIPKKAINLHTMDEAFTSENFIVRIYQVKDLDNLGRSLNAAASFGKSKRKKRASVKVAATRKARDDDDE